jgi:hypothetical protein
MIAPDTPPIEAIIERDIDLLLLEEMHASRDFVDWLISRTFDSNERCSEFISARHSVSNEGGESDLILVFRDMSGGTCGLLLEDKLNAPPQPDQANDIANGPRLAKMPASGTGGRQQS